MSGRRSSSPDDEDAAFLEWLRGTNYPPIELRPFATIIPSADGTWQPDEKQPGDEGIDATLFQLKEPDGSLYDVVAWETAGNGSIWWLRYGQAAFLGEGDIELANSLRKPVQLVPTPREFVKHRLCCCILNWKADVRAILGLAQYGWLCTSPTLARRAQTVMRERHLAKIQLVA
jgi:hypothetical protein